MGTIVSYFNDFLENIRLSDELKEALKEAHHTLRDRLKDDGSTRELLVESFLQGSYARSTCIKPKDGEKVDVDVIIVTNLDHNTVTAKEAFGTIMPFVEKYYEDYQLQKRSIGIFLPKVDVDLVITAAPSEEVKSAMRIAELSSAFTVEDLSSRQTSLLESYRLDALESFFGSGLVEKPWSKEPLWIPDSKENDWFRTHPLEQIRWTKEKNAKCNRHYVNVVKAIKWWKRQVLPGLKHPKSYPLEHFVGDCCPSGITSVAEGITRVFSEIVSKYPTKPKLPDRGVPEHDVFESLSAEDYNVFYSAVCQYLPIALKAFNADSTRDSVELWQKFFNYCDEFPSYTGPQMGFTRREQRTEEIPSGRFG